MSFQGDIGADVRTIFQEGQRRARGHVPSSPESDRRIAIVDRDPKPSNVVVAPAKPRGRRRIVGASA